MFNQDSALSVCGINLSQVNCTKSYIQELTLQLRMCCIGWTGPVEWLKPAVILQADEGEPGEEAAESGNPGLSQALTPVGGGNLNK